MRQRLLMIIAVCLMASATSAQTYDFQYTKLDDNKRVQLFIKHLTLEEKMSWMAPMLGTPRLGIPVTSCYEGLHGLALGGPSRNNGVKTVDGKEVPNDLPTTIFPQAYGMGCTWDRSLIQRIGEIEAEEVRDILDLPHMLDYNIRNGRTYMYFKGEVLYPFGYGLSYTKFNYGDARVQKQDKQKVYVSIPVTNAGSRDGDEVVQLYVSYPDSKVEHPKRQLKAFERVNIPAGQTKEVILEVAKSDLTYWDEARHAFIPETGRIKFEIGASSADIRKEVSFEAK